MNNNKTKFTPGKWEFLDDRAIVSGDILIAQTNKVNDRNNANAALIAAAPSLYEMLEKFIDPISPSTDLRVEAIELLKRARGE